MGPSAILLVSAAIVAQSVVITDKEVARSEAALVEFFKEESNWTEVKVRTQLLTNLELARKLRLQAAAPVLVRHIAFTPFKPNDLGLRPASKTYPAMATLTEIGLPAVPALLELLETVQPKETVIDLSNPKKPKVDLSEEKEQTQLRRNLAIQCLVAIYNEGGDGVALARLRVTLQMERAKGERKKLLQHALDQPALEAPGGKR